MKTSTINKLKIKVRARFVKMPIDFYIGNLLCWISLFLRQWHDSLKIYCMPSVTEKMPLKVFKSKNTFSSHKVTKSRWIAFMAVGGQFLWPVKALEGPRKEFFTKFGMKSKMALCFSERIERRKLSFNIKFQPNPTFEESQSARWANHKWPKNGLN